MVCARASKYQGFQFYLVPLVCIPLLYAIVFVCFVVVGVLEGVVEVVLHCDSNIADDNLFHVMVEYDQIGLEVVRKAWRAAVCIHFLTCVALLCVVYSPYHPVQHIIVSFCNQGAITLTVVEHVGHCFTLGTVPAFVCWASVHTVQDTVSWEEVQPCPMVELVFKWREPSSRVNPAVGACVCVVSSGLTLITQSKPLFVMICVCDVSAV